MTINQMRRLDYFGGISLCFFLTYLEKARSLFFKKKNVKNDKILVIKCWGIGSIVLAIEAFQKIRQAYPNSRISVITLRQNKQIYEMINLFDEIIDLDVKSLRGFLDTFIKLIIYFTVSSFDMAFDFEFTSRFSTIICYLSGAGERVGFKYKGVWRGKLYTKEIVFKENVKIKQSFIHLVDGLSQFNAAPKRIYFKIPEKEITIMDNILKRAGLSDKNSIIGLNINASNLCLLRRWPKEYFIELVDRLIEKYHFPIIFIGDKDDTLYINGVVEYIKNKQFIHNSSGQTTLAQLACLMKKFSLFITNDSGPLHLAVYLNIPTVSFFGPETPLLYGPEGDNHIVLYKGVECSPCIRIKNYKYHRCLNDNICLKQILPQEVMDEIERKGIF